MKDDQNLTFLWVKQSGGTENNIARGVSVDQSGHIWVTGSFQGQFNADDQPLISNGNQDIFLTQYNPQGQVLWAKSVGSRGKDFAFDLVHDPKGNSFLTGLFTEQVNFDSWALTSWGSGDMFIAKIDREGKFLWVRQMGGRSLDGGNEIATDPLGNALAVGNSYGSFKIGSQIFRNQGNQDTFITKYDPEGNFLWARQIAGAGDERGRGIDADINNNIMVTGEFIGTLNLGSLQLTSTSDQRDIFVAKYSPNGDILWAKSFGGIGEDYGRGIGTDQAGNIYWSGVFTGQVKLGDQTFNSQQNSADIVLVKMDSSGNIIWGRQIGGVGQDEGCEIEIDSSGNAYISGEFSQTALVGSLQLTSLGARDLFIAKFDPQGNLVWVQQAGGNGDDVNYAIAVDSEGKTTTVGTFTQTANFGTFKLSSAGNNADFFIAQLAQQ